MRKLLCLLVFAVFCTPVYAGELIIEHVGAKNQESNSVHNANSYTNSSGSGVSRGDTQESVAQKMGKPDIVTNKQGGGQVWVYTKTQKIANEAAASAYNGFGSNAASFNAQIANSGFDTNIYSGGAMTVPVVEAPDSEYKSYSINIIFNNLGVVENVVSTEK